MRLLLAVALMLVGLNGLAMQRAEALPICPNTANTNTDCGFLITIGPGGAISTAAVTGAKPYDGNDDVIVGVINNSGSVYNGSFQLSGTGNGGGVFGFDGDGICTYVSASYCSTAQYGYEGPLNRFTNINASETSGTVDFSTGAGIVVGGTSFFSLEGSPASIVSGGGLNGGGGTNATPEPATLAILGAGLVGLLAMRRRARS